MRRTHSLPVQVGYDVRSRHIGYYGDYRSLFVGDDKLAKKMEKRSPIYLAPIKGVTYGYFVRAALFLDDSSAFLALQRTIFIQFTINRISIMRIVRIVYVPMTS